MSPLDKKNGNLRGVKLYHSQDQDQDWTSARPVQGWVVKDNKQHKFNLYFRVEGHEAEITLTKEALYRMADAISDKTNSIQWLKGTYGSEWNFTVPANVSCTVDGCICQSTFGNPT